ncbi:MAG: serine/threonine protein kinase [Bradymonadia bacterium]|jgi:serine/threonine protein kinase
MHNDYEQSEINSGPHTIETHDAVVSSHNTEAHADDTTTEQDLVHDYVPKQSSGEMTIKLDGAPKHAPKQNSGEMTIKLDGAPKHAPKQSGAEMTIKLDGAPKHAPKQSGAEMTIKLDGAPKHAPKQSGAEMTIQLLNSSGWEDRDYQLPTFGDNFEHYRILSMLGKGGFGAVFKVKNLNLGRDEALKMILPEAENEVDSIQKRFEREVDLVSQLEHPNIVRLYHFGKRSDGALWMTMQLLDGETLEKRLEQGRIPFLTARKIALQILKGLREAHKCDIVHRDLKPANIILSSKEGYEDLVTILDFGLSKCMSAESAFTAHDITMSTDKVYGSPQYMAPEQLRNEVLSPNVDVYAFALIFYEMLLGKPAFEGTSLFDIAYKQSYNELELPKSWNNTALAALLRKAAAKLPQERYATSAEIYEDLLLITSIDTPASVLANSAKIKQSATNEPDSLGAELAESTSSSNKDAKALLKKANSDPKFLFIIVGVGIVILYIIVFTLEAIGIFPLIRFF